MPQRSEDNGQQCSLAGGLPLPPGLASAAGRLLPVAVLWLLCLAFLWPLVTPDEASRVYFGRGDLTDQFFAFRRFIADELWGGRLPLWNPGMYAGHPALADIQYAVFYPPTLLTILLAGRHGLPFYALQVEVLAHFCLAVLFMYLFARQLTRQRLAAMLSALVFALGGYLTSYPPEQLPVLEASIWLPLALYFAHRATAQLRVGSAVPGLSAVNRQLLWCGAALGMSVLAGHPQSTMLSFYTTLLYLAYRTWRFGGGWRVVAYPAVVALVGLGAGAVQWLPTLEFTGLSTRAAMQFDEVQGGFPLGDLLSLLLPGFVGRTAPLYVGLLPLLLALALAVTRYSAEVPGEDAARRWPSPAAFWALLAALALLLSFGGATFLFALPYLSVPGFGIFRGQERLAFVYSLSLAVLAGYGADLLATPTDRSLRAQLRPWYRPTLWVTAVLLGLAAVFAYVADQGEESARVTFSFLYDRTVGLLAVLIASVLLLGARLRERLAPRVFLGLAVLLVAWDLSTVNRPVNVAAADAMAYFQKYPGVIRYLQGLPQPFRVRNDKALPENFGAVFGLSAVEGNSPLRLRSLQALAEAVDEWRLWQLLDVRAVITRRDPGRGTTLAFAEDDVGVYAVDVPRHTWVVAQARLAQSDAEALALLAAPDFDPYGQAVVRDGGLADLDGRGGQAQVTIYRPHYIAIEAQSEGRSLLVVSEMHYPGWQGRIDGQDAPIYRVDHTLRGMVLTPGAHRVEMVYAPVSFRLGLALSVAIMMVVGIGSLRGPQASGRCSRERQSAHCAPGGSPPG